MKRRESANLRDMAVEYIRRIMKRNCATGDDCSPAESLLIDVIIQALSDSAGIDPEFTKEVDRKDADRFFFDGRCAFLCELLGLNIDFVSSIKKDLLSGKIANIIKAHKRREAGLYGK